MADAFLLLPAEDRREALSVAAYRSGRPAHLLEKDAWVVWCERLSKTGTKRRRSLTMRSNSCIAGRPEVF
jgi:hypothetical protein